MARQDASVGVSDHCGWAILVTVARDGKLLDRRRVELVDEDLPKLPHHHEAQALPLAQALDLVERVRVSAARGWTVDWYQAKSVIDAACNVLQVDDLEPHFLEVRRRIGPPWGKDHRLAMAAAIVAARG